MKPITFWIQNEAIDYLVEEYGPNLEKLTPDSRRELIAFLAVPSEWNWESSQPHQLDDLYPLVENLTRHDKDLLIEAIAASLTHSGNPWVETAREMVAIAQKEGTPNH